MRSSMRSRYAESCVYAKPHETHMTAQQLAALHYSRQHLASQQLFSKFRRLLHQNEANCYSSSGYRGKPKSFLLAKSHHNFSTSIFIENAFFIFSWNLWQDSWLIARFARIRITDRHTDTHKTTALTLAVHARQA